MCTLQVVSGRMWLAALVLVSAGPNLLSEGEGRSGLQVLLSPLTLSRFCLYLLSVGHRGQACSSKDPGDLECRGG